MLAKVLIIWATLFNGLADTGGSTRQWLINSLDIFIGVLVEAP